MSLLQINKPNFHITLAFLIIVLLSSNIHVQAENADKRDMAQTLWEQGTDICNSVNIAFSEKDYQPALKKFKDSLTLYMEIGDKQSEADILTWIAKVYMDIGDSSKFAYAKNCLEQAQDIYNELNSSPGKKASIKDIDACMEAMLLFVTGERYRDDGDKNSALEKFNAALQILSKIGERFYEARILWTIGLEHSTLGNYSESERYYLEALAVFRELGNRGYEGEVLRSLGWLFAYGYDIRLEYTNKALSIFEEFDNKNGIEHCLAFKGKLYFGQGNYLESLKCYEKALKTHKETALLNSSGAATHQGMGYFDIPNEHYKQALDIVQEIGNDPKEGRILYTVGQLYNQMGDYEQAREALKKSMQIFGNNNDIHQQGRILVEIGKANRGLGNYSESIASLKNALEILEGINDSDASKRLAITTLKDVYKLLGDDETAKEYGLEDKGLEGDYKKDKWGQLSFLQKQAHYFIEKNKEDEVSNAISRILVLSKETDDKVFERFCLSSIGLIYLGMKKFSKALDYYKQALEVSRKHNDKAGELIALLAIAGTYDYPFLSDYPNALEFYKQALVIAKETGARPSEEKCLSAMGKVCISQNELEKSEEYYKNALKLSKKMGAQEKIWQAQNKLGQLAYFSGDLQKSKDYYSEAINTIESIRGKISVEEYRTSFIEDKLLVYDFMILTLLELKEDEEAFNYVERAKSRALLDLLGNKIRLEKGKNKELSQEEMKLQKKINELLEKIRKEHSIPKENRNAEMGVWNKELKQTRKQYAKHLLKLKQENPELHSLVSVNPLTLKEVQELIDPDTTLLEYYAIESELEGSPILYVIIWIVDKTNCEIVIRDLPNDSFSVLTSSISTFREKIATLQPDYEKYAEVLYDIFIRPVKPYIKTKRVCIVPHSVLHYLPFHALRNIPEICGIGAVIDMIDGKLNVVSILEGSNVTQAGLKSGDKIIEIDESSTVNMSLQEAVSRLKGDPSTTVLLTIEEGESKTRKKVALERRIIAKLNDYSKFIVSDTKGKELKSPSFLIEEYDIFYAPSASVLKFVLEKRKKVSGKVLAFGNPELGDKNLNLPYAEDELKRIKESYPDTSIYIKDKATEEKAKKLSGDYNIIHFASHGELNPQSPLFSCIKMAKGMDDDGRLEVHEIFNLNLENTSLVTLSACETGLSKLTNGDELIGLTRGFIYAGTPSIVASLWNVNDKSTSDLMSLFYKNLKTHSKVESLRMAQLEMINGEVGRGIVRGVGGITTSKEGKEKSQTSMTVNGSHPYFWAPFILLGDWK